MISENRIHSDHFFNALKDNKHQHAVILKNEVIDEKIAYGIFNSFLEKISPDSSKNEAYKDSIDIPDNLFIVDNSRDGYNYDNESNYDYNGNSFGESNKKGQKKFGNDSYSQSYGSEKQTGDKTALILDLTHKLKIIKSEFEPIAHEN